MGIGQRHLITLCVLLCLSVSVGYANVLTEKQDTVIQSRDTYGGDITRLVFSFYNADLKMCQGAAYLCAGVLVSGFEQRGGYWMQPSPAQSKISLSFWHQTTTGLSGLSDAVFTLDGFMLWPVSFLRTHIGQTLFTPEFSCVFATDGATGNQLKEGCGGWYYPIPTCQRLGIHTAEDFIRYYDDPANNQCGFRLGAGAVQDKEAFGASLRLQKAIAKMKGHSSYDEVLIKGWPLAAPEKIPLLGFYYVDLEGMPAHLQALDEARENQRLYYQATHLFAPIIRVKGKGWRLITFSYSPFDQWEGIPDRVNVLIRVNE